MHLSNISQMEKYIQYFLETRTKKIQSSALCNISKNKQTPTEKKVQIGIIHHSFTPWETIESLHCIRPQG